MSNLHLYTTEQLIETGKRLKWLLDEARKQDLINGLKDYVVYVHGLLTLKAMQEEYKKRINNGTHKLHTNKAQLSQI